MEDNKERARNIGFNHAELEERLLKFWEDNKIFEKTLEKTKDPSTAQATEGKGKPFTFYDGPPFATGLPHYGHILASTIKDLIPRYQTMKGRFVRRRWGWDCHGLPIEEIVERKLGISGKKQIEEIGIEKFNETCRSVVLQYAEEWRKMVRRIARWVEFDNSYKTMDRDYMESVWWAFKQMYDKGLVYEGRRVLLYCPRCETPISNFEVAMDNSYKEVTEEAVTVKFRVKGQVSGVKSDGPIYLLSWTTTPWTLPGNVALAVGEEIDYVEFSLPTSESPDARYIVSIDSYAKHFSPVDKSVVLDPKFHDAQPGRKFKGKDFVSLEYEPLYDVPAVQNDKTFKVYAADFVNTDEGTGIVHTAVVYGEDDYQLGLRVGLPVVPLLDEKGVFNDKAPELVRGTYFKDADNIVIADLENRKPARLLFEKSDYVHSYPHCWRCSTTLYYTAIPAWFVNVQEIKSGLLESNNREMNWFPEHLKHGRYEKSVEAAPDWNISRNRYWGNPIPVWKCESCGKKTVVGSIKELGLGTNIFYFTRHGEAENNTHNINSCYPEVKECELTPQGVVRAEKLAERLKVMGGVDVVIASDLLRTRHTAEIVGVALGAKVEFDERLREYNVGVLNGKASAEFTSFFPPSRRWKEAPEGGETWTDVQNRMVAAVQDINRKHTGKKVLIVSHGDPLWLLDRHFGSERGYPGFAAPYEMDVNIANLHRPYIDDVVLKCASCGGAARRTPEIFDSWIEAGSMPFAEYHYPFENQKYFPPTFQSESRLQSASGEIRFPAQFVAEYIPQTRAWFYLMHVVSFILFGKAPFQNLVTTGTILAEDGSKMSKSKDNFPDPWEVINTYGVDALRFYLMKSPVMQADDLNFTVRDLETTYRKNVLILWNVYKYYETYAAEAGFKPKAGYAQEYPKGVLDAWIWARTKELVSGVTEYLDGYDTVRACRVIEEYIDDLSTWYLRRSRGRKDTEFFGTLRHALINCAKVTAPFMPYISEEIYQNVVTSDKQQMTAGENSVHLRSWPTTKEFTVAEKKLLEDMQLVREFASAGLAERKKLNIPVRQPLARLSVKCQVSSVKLTGDLLEILKAEVNVKDVIFDEKLSPPAGGEVELDVTMTGELRLEGLVRGLERLIQNVRKKNGFKVGEMAALTYAVSNNDHDDNDDLRRALEVFNREKTYISSVKEGDGGDVHELDGKKIALGIERV